MHPLYLYCLYMSAKRRNKEWSETRRIETWVCLEVCRRHTRHGVEHRELMSKNTSSMKSTTLKDTDDEMREQMATLASSSAFTTSMCPKELAAISGVARVMLT
jgi:hypothetical protein